MQFVSEHLEQIIAPKERLMEHQLQVVRWTFEMVISFAKHQINCALLFFAPFNEGTVLKRPGNVCYRDKFLACMTCSPTPLHVCRIHIQIRLCVAVSSCDIDNLDRRCNGILECAKRTWLGQATGLR